jgi:hypothetical protein
VFKKSLKIPKGGNQNPYIEEEQTTQWPREKGQKDQQIQFFLETVLNLETHLHFSINH